MEAEKINKANGMPIPYEYAAWKSLICDIEPLDDDFEKLEKLLKEKNRLERLCKIPHLSVGAKSYLREIYISSVYGRKKDITSKYLSKGTNVEEDSITLLSINDNKLYLKNSTRITTDGLTGEIDIEDPEDKEHLIDTKSSWAIFTFFAKREQDEIDAEYYWQAQGYMHLFNKNYATVAFCLVDTPDDILKQEEKKLLYKFSQDDPMLKEELEELRKRHKFSDIPMKQRVIKFRLHRNEKDIELIKQRVEDSIKYLNFIYDEDFG